MSGLVVEVLTEVERRLAAVAREFEPSPYSFGFIEAIRIIREVQAERGQMEPCAEYGEHLRGQHEAARAAGQGAGR